MIKIKDSLKKYKSYFDGIADDLGEIVGVVHEESASFLQIKSPKLAGEVNENDDLLINGVRGRVERIENDIFTIDVLRKNCGNISSLRDGDKVNLQKSIRPPYQIRAQLVTGEIDGEGEILKIEEDGKYVNIWISYPNNIRPYLFKMGYICVDGICLTIKECDDSQFKVSIFPKTRKRTSLGNKVQSDLVNIESSIIAKILEEVVKATGCIVHERSILHWLISPY